MERYELLQGRYEDARFFLLVEDLIVERAKRWTDENERLKHDPDFILPRHLLENGLKIIRRGRRKAQSRHTANRLKWGVYKIALVCFLAALLITAACALSPALRTQVRNFVVEITEISMDFRDAGDSQVSAESEQPVLMGYILPAVPEGFSLTDKETGNLITWMQFENNSGNMIRFTVSATDNTDFGVDAENPSSLQSTQIGNYACTVIEKNNVVGIYFADEIYGNFISVEAVGLDADTVASFVQEMIHE